jgi:hypothetical protein
LPLNRRTESLAPFRHPVDIFMFLSFCMAIFRQTFVDS